MVVLATLVGAAGALGAALISARGGDGFVTRVTRVTLPQFLRVRLPDPGDDPQAAVAPDIDLALAEAQDGAGADRAAAPGAADFALAAPAGAGERAAGTVSGAVSGTVSDDGAGEAVVVRKTISLAGRSLGALPVHVAADSRLLFDAADLRALLRRHQLAATVEGEGLLDAATLRASGIGLRYDPVSDTMELTIR